MKLFIHPKIPHNFHDPYGPFLHRFSKINGPIQSFHRRLYIFCGPTRNKKVWTVAHDGPPIFDRPLAFLDKEKRVTLRPPGGPTPPFSFRFNFKEWSPFQTSLTRHLPLAHLSILAWVLQVLLGRSGPIALVPPRREQGLSGSLYSPSLRS